MSWDINRVVIVGRLTKDIDLRYTQSGAAVASFGIAVGGRPRDGKENTSFFNIVVWNKAAENCSKYLSKGKQVAIDGHLEQRSWEAQDGSRRSTVEIIADRVEFLGSASGSGSGGGGGGNFSRPNAPTNNQQFDSGDSGEWHDITDFDDTPLDDSDMNDVPF